MNDKSNDIFEFEPLPFGEELPEHERVDYISAINQDDGSSHTHSG